MWDGHALLALTLGADHFDDLPSAGDEITQQPGRFIRQRPWLGLGGLSKVGDRGSINRISLGTLSNRLRESPDLGRVDDHNGKAGGGQGCRRNGLEASGGFQRDNTRFKLSQPDRQLFQSGGIALNRKHLPTRTHSDIEAVFRDVDTNDDAFHGDPSLPNRASRFAAPATVRARWNDRRGATLSHGLQGPRAHRTPARHRDPHTMRVATRGVTRGTAALLLVRIYDPTSTAKCSQAWFSGREKSSSSILCGHPSPCPSPHKGGGNHVARTFAPHTLCRASRDVCMP